MRIVGAIIGWFVQSMPVAHRPLAARPTSALIDLAITTAVLGASLAMLAHGIGTSHPSLALDPVGGLLAAAAAVPLIGWRRAPFAVFLATAAASTLMAGLGHTILIPLAPTVALYLLAASRSEASPWRPLHTAAVAAFLAAYVAAASLAEHTFSGFEHTGLAWAVAWFAGERTRLVRDRIAELEARAVQAEGEAERDRRLAVAEERARIARDLHDSAGHAINVIAVRAGAARLRHDRAPDRSLLALQEIETVARETAGDIDQIVHTLRDRASEEFGGAVAPTGLASLETLVRHHSQTGLEVTVRTKGKARPLAHTADQAAYRILQEALTNAARHGTGAAEVDVDFQDSALRLNITNPAPASDESRSAGGHGLIGMRERAILLSGTLNVDRSNGIFRVSACIPYEGEKA